MSLKWARTVVRLALLLTTSSALMAIVPGASAAPARTTTSPAWTAGAEAPLPAGAGLQPGVTINAAVCPAAGSCVAVGSFGTRNAGSTEGEILVQSAGTWSATVAPVPSNAAKTQETSIQHIACWAAGGCVATGSYIDTSGDTDVVIETLSAGKWTAQEAPVPSGAGLPPDPAVTGLACTAANDCFAIGSYAGATTRLPMVLDEPRPPQWIANEESEAPTATLEAIACATSGDYCAIVGSYPITDGTQAVWLFRGTTFSSFGFVSPPSDAATDSRMTFTSIAFTGTNGVFDAVGSYASTTGTEGFVVERNIGGSNPVVNTVASTPVPTGGSSPESLTSVSCAAACLAFGTYTDAGGNTQGNLVDLGGMTTAEAPLPAGAATNPQVSMGESSCPASGSCSAVAAYTNGSGKTQGVLLDESAGVWSAIAAPLPPNADKLSPSLSPVAIYCSTVGNCTAIAMYQVAESVTNGLILTENKGTWTAGAAPLPGTAGLDPSVSINRLSCPAATESCTGVGTYVDSSGSQQGVLLADTAGKWSAARAPLPAGTATGPKADVQLDAVSCVAGSCVAGGSYATAGGSFQALLLVEPAGKWIPLTAPLPTGALTTSMQTANVSAISCAVLGSCTAVGDYEDGSGTEGLILTESAGKWTAIKATLPKNVSSARQVSLRSLSCPTQGDCTAVGTYSTTSAGVNSGLLLGEVGGKWSDTEAPLPAGQNGVGDVSAVSCSSAGNCAAAGWYYTATGSTGVVLTEVKGVWKAITAPLPPNAALSQSGRVIDLSCLPTGSCIAAGYYDAVVSNASVPQGILLTESAGKWQTAEAPLPAGASATGGAYLEAVSCAAGPSCGATGYYADAAGNEHGWLLENPGGKWSASVAKVPANGSGTNKSALFAASCPIPEACVFAGYYREPASGALEGLIDSSRAPSATSVKPDPATVVYGKEQTVKFEVTVKAAGGVPTGSATVKSGTTLVCVIHALVKGVGSCSTVNSKLLAVGTHAITVSYTGDADFSPSAGSGKLTVTS